MGAQAIDTLGNLLQACEDADRGQIFEPRQALALGYRTLASMCSQSPALELDYAASEPGGADGNPDDSGLDPTYDDLLSRNDWTLTRSAGGGADGATFQYQLNDGSEMSITGIGDYADTKSVNVQSDGQLPDTAGWMVHVGTVDEARWPVIPVNLARTEMSGLYFDALAADIGDYVQIVNAPDLVVYDPVDQLAFQVTEQLGGFHYAMEFNAVPEVPYEVAFAGAARASSPGSQLHTSYFLVGDKLQRGRDRREPVDHDVGLPVDVPVRHRHRGRADHRDRDLRVEQPADVHGDARCQRRQQGAGVRRPGRPVEHSRGGIVRRH